jgi:hypothetical protein
MARLVCGRFPAKCKRPKSLAFAVVADSQAGFAQDELALFWTAGGQIPPAICHVVCDWLNSTSSFLHNSQGQKLLHGNHL